MPDSGIAALTPVTGLNVTLTDRVLSVRINRPSSLNSLTVPILTGIADTLERAAADPVVKVVRLGGVGRGFSSGVSMSVPRIWCCRRVVTSATLVLPGRMLVVPTSARHCAPASG